MRFTDDRLRTELCLDLTQAKEIIIRENLPSGKPPNGMFYNSKQITHSFFESESQELRDDLVTSHMSFLHDLIRVKLEHACDLRERDRTRRNSTIELSDDDENEVSFEEELDENVEFEDIEEEDEPGSVTTKNEYKVEAH